MSVDDLAWPVMILGTVGVAFTVESPAELTDAVRRTGEALLRSA
jgi:hypothetical protein